MPYVLVHQQTTDYARWKQAFDNAAGMRADAGCIDTLVLQDRRDPQKLTILFEFEDLDRAQRYIDDPKLRTAWRQASVKGETEIHLLTPPGN